MSVEKTKAVRYLLYLVNLSALLSFVLLLVWSLTSHEAMVKVFSYGSYYLIFLVMVLWTIQSAVFLRHISFSPVLLLRNYWPGIVLALALTVLVFVSVKAGFRTLSDETNLVSISRSMAANKTVYNCTMAKFYYGNLQPINQAIDIKPLVFPFLVSLLHSFIGPIYQNAFLLNFLVIFLFLSGVFIATRKLLDTWSAAAAMLLILSYPVFTIFGTSAGFDLLNGVFFILVLAITYTFIKSPSSPGFALLFCSLLVFANIRYESIIFFPLMLLLVAPRIKWQHIRDSLYLFCFTPLVMLPYLWNRILKPRGHYESMQYEQLFSFNSLVKNVVSFFTHLVDFSYILPYAGVVTLISILIFIYLIIQAIRGKVFTESHKRHFLIVLLVSVGLSTFIYFAYFFGYYTHPSSARFFMTLSICFALGPVALRIANPQLLSGRALFLLAVVAFLYYHPIAVEGRFINTLILNRQTSHSIDFLKKLDDRNILVVSSRPGQYVAIGYGAVDFDYANRNANPLLNEYSRHLYSKIIVFQEIMYGTGLPTGDSTLDAAYKLEPLYEIQITAESFLKISKVTPPEGQK